MFLASFGDIGWRNRRTGEEGLKDLVLALPERMWEVAFLHACKLPEVAEGVVEEWRAFD